MLVGDLVLGPVTGTYHSLFQKEISNIPTVTSSLFNQIRRSNRHNVSVTRYTSVIKNGHDWSPVSRDFSVKSKLILFQTVKLSFLILLFQKYGFHEFK